MIQIIKTFFILFLILLLLLAAVKILYPIVVWSLKMLISLMLLAMIASLILFLIRKLRAQER